MQFATSTTLAALTSLLITQATSSPTPQASSSPSPSVSSNTTTTAGPFNLLAIRSGSAIQYASFAAAQSSLFANLPSQNASCTNPSTNTATLRLDHGVLSLYTVYEPQQFYVDRSGMGQGKLGYTTGAQPAPTNAEREGWNIKDGYLYFDDAGFIACPNSLDGAWSVWIGAGIENPAGNTDCTTFWPRVLEIAEGDEVPCTYTQ